MFKKICLITVCLLALTFCYKYTEAAIINFDDIVGPGWSTVPNGYSGMNWSGWIAYGKDDYPYTAHSGSSRVFLDIRGNGSNLISWSTPINFNGAWFSGISNPYPASVKFEGYLDGALQGTSSIFNISGTPGFLAANFNSTINSIKVISDYKGYYVMDDVTFNTNAVPEPATMVLLGLGSLAMAAFKRKKKII